MFALVQLLIGVLLWAAPGFFFEHVGPFAPRNDHYMADVATFYLALGIVALIAARRPSWRVPVLLLAVIQNGLHAVNHLIDIGNADPGYLGPLDFAALLATTALLAWMLWVAGRETAP